MNGYERYHAMLQGEAVDYLPRIPILMQYAAEEAPARWSKNQVIPRCLSACIEDLI